MDEDDLPDCGMGEFVIGVCAGAVIGLMLLAGVAIAVRALTT